MKLIFSLSTFLLFGVYVAGQSLARDFDKAPVISWELSTEGPIFASPAIDKDMLYVGSLDSNLYAVDASSGKLRWKYKTGGDIRSTAVIDGESIYVVSGDGKLYALKSTGQIQWKFDAGGDRKYELFSFADYFQSSPLINGDTLFFGTGNGIFAVNKKNGKKIWDYQTGSVVHSSPAFYKDQVLIGSFDGYLYSINRRLGSLTWKFKSIGQRFFPKGEMQGSPLVFEDMASGINNFHVVGLWASQLFMKRFYM